MKRIVRLAVFVSVPPTLVKALDAYSTSPADLVRERHRLLDLLEASEKALRSSPDR